MSAGERLRPVLLVWALTSTLTSALYLRAALDPPAGRVFGGFFYYYDDHYNYLSFVQQAEDGAFFFVNKLVTEEHAPALANLEWWLVGRISALLGRRPLLAYRVFGLLAALALLLAVDRWLRHAGLPASRRLPALALVSTGAGLGGVQHLVFGRPPTACPDLFTGIFPVIGLLANPHFVAGTSLLLWALWAHMVARGLRGHVFAALLGNALGLVRPYDFVLLAGVRGLGVVLTEPARRWPARLAPLLGLLPVAAYSFWIFYTQPAFAFYARAPYGVPALLDLLPGIGPAALLAGLALGDRVQAAESTARRHLVAWIAVGAAVVAARPVPFSLQFLVGLGIPLLSLGALGLARFRVAASVAALVALAPTAVAAGRLVTQSNARWFVLEERLAAARALRESCRSGDVALAPPDIGLHVGGFTACKPYVSHPVGPDYERRRLEAQALLVSWSPAERADFLDRHCITHLTLPGDAGVEPAAWLGEQTAFRRLAVVGESPRTIGLYARDRAACRAIRPSLISRPADP
jgi:hypothetical protein